MKTNRTELEPTKVGSIRALVPERVDLVLPYTYTSYPYCGKTLDIVYASKIVDPTISLIHLNMLLSQSLSDDKLILFHTTQCSIHRKLIVSLKKLTLIVKL